MSVVKSKKYSFQFWEVACFKWPGLCFRGGVSLKIFPFFCMSPFPIFTRFSAWKWQYRRLCYYLLFTCWKPHSTRRTAWGSEGRAWTRGTLWSRLRADCQTWTPPSRGGSCGWWRGSRQTARPLRSRHGRPSQQVLSLISRPLLNLPLWSLIMRHSHSHYSQCLTTVSSSLHMPPKSSMTK